MQERRVVVSRVIQSTRVLPQTKETSVERISRFVGGQKQVVAYPFSAELSVKALGAALKNSKDPSADNKEKKKKGKSNFERYGTAIFDPKAKPQKGQYFEIRPRRINQDGQMGDVPNFGWLDPLKTVKPEDLVSRSRAARAADKTIPIRKVPARKNPRTGAMEVKALGNTIGRAAGNIGQAAARAIGIVVDASGKFRCPPGVPAANQFTDEVGSNCFDFSPLVARALVAIAQKFGQETMQTLTNINSASPFERDGDYRLVPRGSSLRSSGGRLRGTILGPDGDSSRLRGSLLGPDGKPISSETIAAEDARAVTDELIAAERDLSRLDGVVVDPEAYEEEFEKALRAAFPEKSAKEIKEMAKVAADRERMKDKLRQEQRDAIAVIRRLGIEVDESDPVSVQRGLALALNKMQQDGWGVDLDTYFGKGFKENPERALLAHRQRVATMAVDAVMHSILTGGIDGLNEDDLEALGKRYGANLGKRITDAIASGANPKDVFPDDTKAQTLLAVAQNSVQKARQYETGIFMQLVNTRDKTPGMVDELGTVKIYDPLARGFDPNDTFMADMDVSRDGKLVLGINIHGMIQQNQAQSMRDSDNYLFEPAKGAGTEIEKLKRIGEVVTAENRARLLSTYFDDLQSFGQKIEEIREGKGFLTESLDKSFGGIALGQFVGIHELVHGRQLLIAKEVIMSRNPNMSNEEALEFAMQMVSGRTLRTPEGTDFDYGTMMADTNVLRTAVSNMSDIIGFLIDNKVGGTYGPSHYFETFYINEALRQVQDFDDLVRIRDAIAARQTLVEGPELMGLQRALNQLDRILISARDGKTDRIDMLRDLKRTVNFRAQVTYMEMQADLSAAVQLGLIKETPEIKAFLAPLSLGQDMPAVRASIVPPAPPAPPAPPSTRREKIKKLAQAAKKARKMTMVDLSERALDILTDIEDGYSFEDRGLMSRGLASAARFEGRGAASRWGKQVRDASLMEATEEQIAIIENVEWRLKHDIKTPISTDGKINEPKMRQRLLLGGIGDQWMADEMESTFLPFVEVIDNSKLPNSVAAEIVVPGDVVGFPGENMQGRRFEVGTHFTGVLKDNDSLGSAGGLVGQGEGQRLIVAVPEGYSGLPDYTPGTNKSEVGSIILPPGEIEIVGVREDGVAIGRVVSQRSADDIIDSKKQELKAFDEKIQDVGQKITVRKAINRIERKQGVRSLAALRSSGTTNDALPDADRTKIPAEKSPRTQDVLEQLNSRGIKFGKAREKTRAEKRKQKLDSQSSRTASVKRDLREFESPEEASVRVSRHVDDAVEKIQAGKLEGLAPEVAETLKDKSPEEIRELLVESARSFVDGLDKRPRFRMRSTPVRDVQDSREIPFDGFLKTGVYKTTYDANEIGVASASGVGPRKEYETLLGIPEDSDSSIRPAHGFFTHRDEMEFIDDWKKTQIDAAEKRSPDAVSFRDPDLIPPASGSNNTIKDPDGTSRKIDAMPSQYGDTEIVLRTDAASRSVATMGDSLNGYRTPFALDGSSTDDELLEGMLLNRSTALDKPGLSAPTERRIANLLNASIGKNHAQTTDFSKPGDDTGRDYVEAIVAGSFDMSDVEEIRISPELQDARTRVSSVKANDVRDSDVRELLANVLPEKDIDAATKLISETQTDPKAKQAATAVRELIASRLSLVRERSSRRDIRRQVTQRSSGDRVPKVTFLNREGINIDDHRTFKRTSDALAMGEEYEIDDIVKYGAAQKVREQLSAAGISASPQESFAAMKPKPVREPRASLRSSGATRSRDDVLREILSQKPPETSPNPIDLKNAEILKKAEAKGVKIDNDEKTKKLIRDRLALLDDKRFPQNSDYEREKIKLVPVSDYRKQSIELAVRSGKSDREILFELPGSLEDKPGVADDFATRLTLTRVIAEARGDTRLVEDIDKFVADVASMDNAQFAAEYLEASKKFESPLDQRSVVMTQAPHVVVESGRYKTVHEGSSSMGGQADRAAGGAEKIAEIRRQAEMSRLGFDPNDTDAETASLRPSSSLTLSTHFAEDRAEKLKKIYGDDVVVQYDYSTVSAAGFSKATRGDKKEKNNLVDGRAYGQASIILRPEVAQRTLAVSGDSVSGGVNSPASRLSTIKENPEAAALFHSPQSVMFEARTGRKNTIASAAQNEDTNYYVEGMTVGSFGTQDIQAIVTPLMSDNTGSGIAANYIEFGEPNDSATGMNLSATITALIGGARARDDYAEKYKIDVVLQSIFFDLNEVEPFNPTMTQGYIAQQVAKGAFGGVKVEDLKVTPTTTPYEILLQVKKMNALRGEKIGGFLHPKNVRGNTPEAEATNRKNYVAMIDEELSRLSGSPTVSGIDPVDRGGSREGSRRLIRRMDEGRPQLLGDSRSAVMARQGRENTTRLAQREALRSSGSSTSVLSDGSGARSSFRTRGVGASLRSSGATRSTDIKISEGPVNLPNGLDSQNLPKVLSSVELEQKFGDSPRKHKRHFARYGVKLKGEVPTDPVEKESYYSSLQALDDLFQNVDPKKLLKGQKIEIEVGSNVEMLSGEYGVLGEFNRSRRIFFTAGPQKGQIRIDTAELGRKGTELFQYPNRLGDGLRQYGLPDFVSRLFLNEEALNAPDAENEMARRLSYASMVHEFGHLLDYLAVKKENKMRWRSAMGSTIFGEQDAETLRRGTMMSASMEDELNELPSVSVYGQSSPQEKMAEGFAAWWLFSKRPDIQLMGMGGERIVESLLEELGPRVKSAKQSSKKKKKDSLPPLVALYTLLPFMIEGGENK